MTGNATEKELLELQRVRARTEEGLRNLLSYHVAEDKDRKKAAKAANVAANEEKTREVNRDCLQAFDWALVRGCGWGLAAFKPERKVGALPRFAERYFLDEPCDFMDAPRSRACIELRGGERYYEVPWTSDAKGQHVRPTLHLAQDQGSGSWPGGNWLVQGLKIRSTLIWDRFHRVHNDYLDALAEAGLAVVRLEQMQTMSLRRGPWCSDGNHATLFSAVSEMSRMLRPESELFGIYYNEICRDFGENGEDVGSDAHYEKMWLKATSALKSAGKGFEAKKSRWFATEALCRDQRELRGSMKLLLMYVGFRRKWWSTLDESPLAMVMGKPLLESDGEPAEGVPPVEGGAEAAEGEQEVDAEMDAPSANRQGQQKSREEVRRRRAKCAGHMQFAARVMHRPVSTRLWNGVLMLTEPVEERFYEEVRLVKQPDTCMKLHMDLTTLHHYNHLLKVLGVFFSVDCAEALGISGDEMDREIKKSTLLVVRTLWRFVLSFLRESFLTQMKYEVPPRSFLPLVHHMDDVREKSLDTMKKTHECIERLEAAAHASAQARRYVDNMEWPAQCWVRENFSYLLETRWSYCYPFLKEDIKEFGQSHTTTLPLELSFNHIRKVARKNRRQRIESKGVWHAASLSSPVPDEFQRPLVPVTPAARMASVKKVPDSLFKYEQGEGSLVAEEYEHLTSKKPDWPTHGPANHNLAALLAKCMLACEGDFKRMERCVFSLLAQPNAVVYNVVTKELFVVIATTQYGFFGMNPVVSQLDGGCLCPVNKFL